MNMPPKIVIERDAPNGSDTDHLLPVVDFLKAHGNLPAGVDAFEVNRDGLSEYGFTQPIDIDLLQQHFTFPTTIHLSADGVHDTRHFVQLRQGRSSQPVRPLWFEPVSQPTS